MLTDSCECGDPIGDRVPRADLRSGLGIAICDGEIQLFMLVANRMQIEDALEADLPARADTQRTHDADQQRAVSGFGDRGVERRAGTIQSLNVPTLERGGLVVEVTSHLFEIGGGGTHGRESRREGFERLAKREEVLELLLGKAGDEGPTTWAYEHESLCLELEDGLAQRDAGNLQLIGELAFDEPLAGKQGAAEDALAQLLNDSFSKGEVAAADGHGRA